MKTLLLSLMLFGFVNSTFALDQSDIDQRIRALGDRLDTLQSKPGKAIPYDIMKKAHGIILLERSKGGVVFGYEGGHGVAMVRSGHSKWSPAAFMVTSTSSFGLQLGGEQNFLVILIMDDTSTHSMTQPSFDFGGEARGTAGNSSGGAEDKTTSVDAPVLIYDDRNGFYNGAVVKGGTLTPDQKANEIYYGQPLTMQDILFDKKVKATQSAIDLGTKLTKYSKKPKD